MIQCLLIFPLLGLLEWKIKHPSTSSEIWTWLSIIYCMYTVQAPGQQAKVRLFFAGVITVVYCSLSYCRGQNQRLALSFFLTYMTECVYLHCRWVTAWKTKGEYQGKKFTLSWLNFQSTSSQMTACKTHVDVKKKKKKTFTLNLQLITGVTPYTHCNTVCDFFVWASKTLGGTLVFGWGVWPAFLLVMTHYYIWSNCWDLGKNIWEKYIKYNDSRIHWNVLSVVTVKIKSRIGMSAD